jgi:hypothetical protein
MQGIVRGGKAHTEDMAGRERLKPPAVFCAHRRKVSAKE